MILTTVLQAIGLFATTNIDDIIVLSLFFARGAGQSGTTARILAGQYLGFAGILVAAILVTIGAGAFLPPAAIPYFGLIPLGIGLWAAWQAWRGDDNDDDDEAKVAGKKVGVGAVAGVTFANGGDNIGVYTPVFLSVEPLAVVAYCVIFLALVAVLVALAKFVATRPPDRGSARTLGGHPLSHRSHRPRHRDPRQWRSLRALTEQQCSKRPRLGAPLSVQTPTTTRSQSCVITATRPL